MSDLVEVHEDCDCDEELVATNNAPLDSINVQPRIFFGEPGEPFSAEWGTSDYIDNNISQTWNGLMSFYV